MYFLFPGRTPEEQIPSSKQLQLFVTLKDAVTKDLLHKIALEETPRKRKSGRKPKASHVKAATNTPDDGEMLESRLPICATWKNKIVRTTTSEILK